MSRSEVRQALTASVGSDELVRIARSPRNSDVIDGFVVGVGRKWALVVPVADGGYLDGLLAVRVRDVVRVESKEASSFEGRFARTQADWPPHVPDGIDLDKTAALITGLSRSWPLIGVEQEDRFKDSMQWIGVVDDIADGHLWLREVRPDGTWKDQPLGYPLRRITKVEVADRYKLALAAIAGTDPCAQPHCRDEPPENPVGN